MDTNQPSHRHESGDSSTFGCCKHLLQQFNSTGILSDALIFDLLSMLKESRLINIAQWPSISLHTALSHLLRQQFHALTEKMEIGQNSTSNPCNTNFIKFKGRDVLAVIVRQTASVLDRPFSWCAEFNLPRLAKVQKMLYNQCVVRRLILAIRLLKVSDASYPLNFLCRLILSSEYFAKQFVAFGGLSLVESAGFLTASSASLSSDINCVTIDILQIISHLARISIDNYELILKCNILPHIQLLLVHPDSKIRAKCCNLVGNLCKHSSYFYPYLIKHNVQIPDKNSQIAASTMVATPPTDSMKSIVGQGVDILTPLIKCANDPDPITKRFAIFAIGNAIFHNDTLLDYLQDTIDLLVALLKDNSNSDKCKANAAGALGNFVRNSNAMAQKLVDSGTVEVLLQVACEKSKYVSTSSSFNHNHVATTPGGSSIDHRLLSDESTCNAIDDELMAKRNAVFSLGNLASSPLCRDLMLKIDAYAKLVPVAHQFKDDQKMTGYMKRVLNKLMQK
jgi:hypothetical protein